ncbi:DUF4401 domain-containing protein [Alginatibacterium sediminis]|uniref:DUF4401 domain-containing protein n=1 Tax=Alginatibacterium sediminis TaxID=2164068 RepID=A0A420ELD2_9ALTE|nr:DUF4401 domain-containing protein [Alginatibacterium sediminis]RKF21450.1 DUF4401 domain-containing protein [Alginatibacterium sediminis]
MEPVKTNQLWQILSSNNLVDGLEPTFDDGAPWYLKILMAVSGWIAALSILGFLALALLEVFEDPIFASIFGFILIGCAFLLLRSQNSDFREHIGLALSCAGQGLLVWALFSEAHGIEFWLGFALMQLLLALLMPNALHRTISALCCLLGLAGVGAEMSQPLLAPSIGLILSTSLWLREFQFGRYISQFRALGYGLTLGSLLLSGAYTQFWLYDLFLSGQLESSDWFWSGGIIQTVVAMLMLSVLLRRYDYSFKRNTTLLIYCLALLVCFVAAQASGVLVAIIVLILGFSRQNRILMSLGIAFGLLYLSFYYYHLSATLLEKSQLLAVLALALAMIPRLIRHTMLKDNLHE